MADRPLTLGFITLIKALCQQSFGLTLPQNCVSDRPPSMVHSEVKKTHIPRPTRPRLGTAGRRGLLIQIGLFVRVEAGKHIERFAGTYNPQISERIFEYFPGFQMCD